ncbi:hypothetical protein MFU01_25060 [Myxococcus fulvus]|uniref:Uncharacterized protein n=1 Tax=Myxococcus fulvus TaxID=33 RepID=A0A511SZY3_MYXFU|nr:hypothetical protein MFU01_25060 [Myxococcus fulvus]
MAVGSSRIRRTHGAQRVASGWPRHPVQPKLPHRSQTKTESSKGCTAHVGATSETADDMGRLEARERPGRSSALGRRHRMNGSPSAPVPLRRLVLGGRSAYPRADRAYLCPVTPWKASHRCGPQPFALKGAASMRTPMYEGKRGTPSLDSSW